jgi:hypothetical protein
MPKALSSLLSVQRSYTSELSVAVVVEEFGVIFGVVGELLVSECVRELVSKEGREPGVRRLTGLHRLRWLRSCDVFSRELVD